MTTTFIFSIIALVLAILAVTFGAIALHKSISNEKFIDDIYEWAENLDKLIDRIIETIGMQTSHELKKEIETLARKIDFDKEGNPIIPDELKEKLKPEQLQDIEKHLRIAKKIGDGIAEIFCGASEAHKTNNEPSNDRKPAKSQEKRQNKVYSQEFKDEVRKYAAENPDKGVNAIAKHFGISKNSVKRWIAKS